jgi:apolipoprotein N-acyltransferase
MHPRRREELIALISGGALTLGFAPLNLFPLSILSTALLFGLWLPVNPRRAAWLGFLYGTALFATGISWVYVSMHNFGNMPSPLALFATLLFAALMALYLAAIGFLQARYRGLHPSFRLVVIMPVLWATLEWLRGWLFTGFPWLSLGDTQLLTPVVGFAPWFGVYFLSLVAAVTGGLLVVWYQQGWRAGWRAGAAIVALWLTGWLAGTVQWVEPAGSPVRVAMVQGNVPLKIKWDPYFRDAILARYLSMSRAHTDADLIVWPEGALPTYLNELDSEFANDLAKLAAETKTDFLFGAVDRTSIDGETRYFNAVASIGSYRGVYHKRHLVPFGEYPPLRIVFAWLLDAMDIPMSDFSSGPDGQAPLPLANQSIGVSICYETAFAAEFTDALPASTMLVNVSENAWFGDSLGPHQLLQMTRMRAIETGRPIVRTDNAGLSAVIDHEGRLRAVSPQFKQSVVATTVQPMTGSTLYVRSGNLPLLLVLLAGLVAGEWLCLRARRGG